MNTFFPTSDYKLPVSSNYMNPLQEGENTFRVLSSAIIGWEYWNTDGKPVRMKERPDEVPHDIKIEKDGHYRINHFWAFVVWNYEAKKIQILELTQKGIMKTIEGLVKNLKWGNPKDYDITITRSGSGFDTEYSVVPNPKEEIDTGIAMQYERMSIDLDALYSGGDPFMQKK